ncbi:uncharacterized protein SCHCODRAFT_02621342 [Schizophyllum commune H4-8]|nr:uncharacterized protein SCHCODRAFT_02621342 [Schizophyllum commune H4-8]KAI5893280.1 hypothetical protein SCHCODRAFT_02621342 [Schizophyllum commune H4-8]
MAELPAKRPLTDTHHSASVASNVPPPTGATEDLAAALRNIGSRVRKHVTEGYRSAPSPNASPTKANIFRTANDALQDALHSLSKAGEISPRKRGRVRASSVSEEEDVPRAKDGEDTVMADPFIDTSGAPLPPQSIFNRPMKPLRKARAAAHSPGEGNPHQNLASNVALDEFKSIPTPMEG